MLTLSLITWAVLQGSTVQILNSRDYTDDMRGIVQHYDEELDIVVQCDKMHSYNPQTKTNQRYSVCHVADKKQFVIYVE